MATALVTGGTSGIGLTFARHLARRGYDIVLVARDVERLRQTADSVGTESGKHVEILRADLADRGDVDCVVDRISAQDRPVELLVNNAGFAVRQPLATADIAVHRAAMEVMCGAVLALGAAAARTMVARGHGTIINVSSTAGFMTMGSYSTMKTWVTAYSESLAVELRGTGVGVTALCPGWVRTEFHERAGIDQASIPSWLWADPDRVVAICLKDVARGRVISIPTARYKALMWCVRHLPRGVVRAISGKISSRRTAAEPGNGVSR
jgi:uncharacterized protein